MKEDFVAYDNLRVAPYEFEYIKDMKIENDINNHATLKISGVIDDKMKDSYVLDTDEETKIQVYYQKDEDSIPIFNGIITNIKIDVVEEVYVMTVEAKSFTYKLDIYKMKRDFQNINMTTHELIGKVMQSYPDAVYDINIPNEPIKQFTLQYNETDYEFLKRIVSRYHQGIICDIENENIHFFLGTPDMSVTPKTKILNYTVYKDIQEYNDVKNNDTEDILETDFITYKIRTQEILNTGEHFSFKGQQVYVKKSIYMVDEGKLENIYELSLKGGLRSKYLYNMNLIGISIKGNILEVQRDRVKAALEINPQIDSGTAYWFPYATVAASPDGGGWYCMPEVGESVRMNCPTKDESESFVVNAIETHESENGGGASEDRMSNPDNKSLQTAAGQEVKFTPNGANISCSGGQASVNLNKDGTVDIVGQKNVNIACAQSLSIRAEKELTVSAQKSIDMLCEAGGNLVMSEGDEILVSGTRTLNNG